VKCNRCPHTGIRVLSSHEEVLAFASVENDPIKMINAGAEQTAKKQVEEGKAKNWTNVGEETSWRVKGQNKGEEPRTMMMCKGEELRTTMTHMSSGKLNRLVSPGVGDDQIHRRPWHSRSRLAYLRQEGGSKRNGGLNDEEGGGRAKRRLERRVELNGGLSDEGGSRAKRKLVAWQGCSGHSENQTPAHKEYKEVIKDLSQIVRTTVTDQRDCQSD
jgi:hypothetical protein